MPDVDKLTAVMTAIEEVARLLGVSTLKEWRGNKTLMALLTNGEHEALLKRLVELGKIKSAVPTPIISLGFIDEGTDLRLLEDPHSGALPPYDVELNHPVEEYSGAPRLEDTTLHIGQHLIKLGRGSHNFTLLYCIVAATIKKPYKPQPETRIMTNYLPEYEDTGRGRAISDATRRLNQKIKQATGIERLFDYSTGYVTYIPDRAE